MAVQAIDFLGLNIFKADGLEETKKTPGLADFDLVELSPKLAEGFWRPLKISWRMEITDRPIIEQIRSKRARKQIRSDEKKLASLGIEIKIIPELSEEIFRQWLSLYEEKMKEKEKGIVVIGPNWLKNKISRRIVFGAVLAYCQGQIIGGNLFHRIKDRLSLSYGVAERTEGLIGGLGLLLDYYSLLHAQKSGFKLISFGQDENFYGFHLSSGLLFYKAKLGLKPVPAYKTAWATTFFLNLAKFDEQLLFFVQENEEFILNVICKGEIPPDPAAIYLPLGVKESRVLAAQEVLDKNRKFLLT
jgi:hypothetical protein